jgi:putative chitinase
MAAPLTAAQLQIVFPDGDPSSLDQVAAELNTNLPAYGLDTAARQAHFFAQVRQENGSGLDALLENLNYSPDALIATYSYYVGHRDEAAQDGYDRDPVTKKIRRPANQQAIANKTMGGKYGNGDIASGDGWRYRGRGFLQITFKGNYAAITQRCKQIYAGTDVDFVANPDAAATLPGAVRVGVGFWLLNGLPQKADMGTGDADVDRITRVINSGMKGADERRANFRTALSAFS